MNPTEELKELVEAYARGELTDEEFLRRIESQRIDLRERRQSDPQRQEATMTRAHAAIRRIGRL